MNTAYKYDIINFLQEDQPTQDDCMPKTLHDINLADLIGTDHAVWFKRNPKFGFDLEIENEEEGISYQEKALHPYALESLATFCRSFLSTYSNVIDKEQNPAQ